MPSITIDNKEIECRDGVSVLQAALEAAAGILTSQFDRIGARGNLARVGEIGRAHV